MAKNKNVINGLGVVFFLIFYRTVVFSYKKQKKDYEDRVKIEKADAEERKKIRELESEMGWTEAGADDDDNEPGKGEENPYLRMTKQFMKSGARVRRAQNKRLPQYLERGVDVKFTDVAGLGKIRLELEEIVKFFTHGEMYRRRGIKIPGLIYLNSLITIWQNNLNCFSLRERLCLGNFIGQFSFTISSFLAML
jgi:cbb3-type cytochrome oxidase subunit 3